MWFVLELDPNSDCKVHLLSCYTALPAEPEVCPT